MQRFWLLLLVLLLAGCSAVETTPDVDLVATGTTATAGKITVTIKNVGQAVAASFSVKFTLDEIFVSSPESKTVLVSGLAGGAVTTVETYNTLSSSDGDGQHYVAVYADYANQVEETNELNGYDGAYYYDGAYEGAYDYLSAQIGTLRSSSRTTVRDYWGWPASGSYDVHLVDNIDGASGLRSTRKILGTNTSVLLLDLSTAASGYSHYRYDGELVDSNSSQEVLLHEMCHAFHWEYCYDYSSRWNDLPSWLKEGVAVYTAGHGPDRVGYYVYINKLNNYTTAETREMFLGAILGGTHDETDYAGDYLLVKYIVSHYGYTVMRQVLYDTVNGVDAETSIVNRLSGVSSWSGFLADLRAYIDEVLAEYWGRVTTSGVSIQEIKQIRSNPPMID